MPLLSKVCLNWARDFPRQWNDGIGDTCSWHRLVDQLGHDRMTWLLIVQCVTTWPGLCLNIKTAFLRYGDSHVKDKTVVRPSYLSHGDPYTRKTTYFILRRPPPPVPSARDHSGYGFSQWEEALLCNACSHWPSPYPEWSLQYATSHDMNQ